MSEFGITQVAKLAGVSEASVRSMVRSRYVTPRKGPRGALRFSFRDLVVLRTARGLRDARVPARRIGDALRSLQSQLPADAPAAGLSVKAVGDRIVVQEGGADREARSGQYLLAFDVRRDGERIELTDVADRAAPKDAPTGEDECERRFQAALALEDGDARAAIDAYRACLETSHHPGAHTNLGRLLHLQGRISEAVAHYRAAPEPDAVLLFNLGVALEDLGQETDAAAAYEQALALDPDLADAHYNLAGLWERLGEPRRAVRHLNAWRRLERQG